MFIKNKIFIIVAIFVIAGTVLGYQFFIKKNGEPDYKTYRVLSGNVSQQISETGIVKASEELNLGFRTSGKVERVFVAVGDTVKEGQELIRLNTRELKNQLNEAEATLSKSKAQLNNLLAGSSPEEIRLAETAVQNAETSLARYRSAESSAQIELQNAEQNLENVKNKASSDLANLYEDVPDVLQDAHLKANDALNKQIDDLFSNDNTQVPTLTFDSNNSQAKNNAIVERVASTEALSSLKDEINQLGDSEDARGSALSSTKNDLTTIRTLLATLTVALNDALGLSGTTLATYKTSVNTALTNINAEISDITSHQQLISAQRITNLNNTDTAKSQVDTAKASLDTAKHNVYIAEGTLKKAQDELSLKKAGPTQEEINIYNAQVKAAEASVVLIRDKITDSSLSSPIDGIITEVNKKAGETAQMQDRVISLVSSGKFQIEVDIYEEDIPLVKMGDPVDIKLVAFPKEIIKGVVLAVDPAEKIIDEVVYYEVQIGFEEEKQGIKQGMTADIIIETASKENILVIPREAIQRKNNKTIVEILKNGVIKETEVELGLEGSDGIFEVISGLKKGDEVILR